jgi:pyrroline-5-carboxylate reductase
MRAVAFLGGGRITSALVAGLRLAGYKNPIVVHDRNPGKMRQLRRQHGVIAEPNLERAVAQARLLIVAVRPESVMGLLDDIGEIDHALTAVSLAAAVPLAKLRGRLGPSVRWARAMPSPACRTGRGLTAVVFEQDLSRTARQQVEHLFAMVGPVLTIPERQFDVFTVTYSSSHGYHALAALARAAEKLGLDRKSALTAAAHALADGILSWREGKIPLGRLLHEAATPGGIAATVMASMDKGGYRRLVEQALRTGMKRAKRNAQR